MATKNIINSLAELYKAIHVIEHKKVRLQGKPLSGSSSDGERVITNYKLTKSAS